MSLMAGLERGSEHPLASAIVAAATERGLAIPQADVFRAVPGKGVIGSVDKRQIAIGSARLLSDYGVTAEGEGLFVAIDGKLAAAMQVLDPVKASAATAIRNLQQSGMHIVMLTGDSQEAAEAVARELGITEFAARLLPEEKAIEVKKLQDKGRIVAMAGDGINDAPALAVANCGIAMGTGTDVAIRSAGITLVRGDLHGVARAIALSRAMMRNIKQNLFFAFIYNLLGVPMAAGLFGFVLGPMFAAAAMTFSSVSVIGNALRLRTVRI